MSEPKLTITGEVAKSLSLAHAELAKLPPQARVDDVSHIDPKRKGAAVKLAALLELAQAQAHAKYLNLHASADDFHASIPLAAVREKALVIYGLEEKPLPASAGGPFRFFIPDFAACQTHEIDECANVKFVDRIELTREKGFDNRPHDAVSHEELHRREQEQQQQQ